MQQLCPHQDCCPSHLQLVHRGAHVYRLPRRCPGIGRLCCCRCRRLLFLPGLLILHGSQLCQLGSREAAQCCRLATCCC